MQTWNRQSISPRCRPIQVSPEATAPGSLELIASIQGVSIRAACSASSRAALAVNENSWIKALGVTPKRQSGDPQSTDPQSSVISC